MVSLDTLKELHRKLLLANATERLLGPEDFTKELKELCSEYEDAVKALHKAGIDLAQYGPDKAYEMLKED